MSDSSNFEYFSGKIFSLGGIFIMFSMRENELF